MSGRTAEVTKVRQLHNVLGGVIDAVSSRAYSNNCSQVYMKPTSYLETVLDGPPQSGRVDHHS